MRMTNIIVAAAFWVSVTSPTTAWPIMKLRGPGELQRIGDKDKPDKQEYKWDRDRQEYKWERGGCKYAYKADKKGVKEKYECR
jgi:hypothetical protein